MEKLRFRQVHLDFHTSPHIPAVGAGFDKKHWQETLRQANVDSITCFSCCHHGWTYHPTKVGKMHPSLNFNLLRAQMDACKEININVPVYLTAGVNNMVAHEHPEWREISHNGGYAGWNASPLKPGFQKLCFNTPYLDYLCELISEAAGMFPEADGIFLDIIFQSPCCCRWCVDDMLKGGFDPEKEEDRVAFSKQVLLKYYRRTTAAAKAHDPQMRIFHNSGHIQCGHTDILQYFSHLELESLPTGGWGYDHYPMSAAYCRKLPFDFLGMTGKFHNTWGEFGGFKHPNALRYECAAMLAQGSKCSVGDQLHPSGKLDDSTYKLIGTAYSEVAAKEPWCDNVTSVANVAILSNTAVNHAEGRGSGESAAEIGACRLLLENHIHFDILDDKMPMDGYKILILADDIHVDSALKTRLEKFLADGGKLILSGQSGLNPDNTAFALDVGASFHGASTLCPDFVLPATEFSPEIISTPFVMYGISQRVKATSGKSLGQVFDPYFNRTYQHFCSHQHTPYRTEPSGFDCGVIGKNILYFAHPVFSIYRSYGAVLMKQYVASAIRQFIGDDMLIRTNMPSQGRVTLMRQDGQRRYVLHLLYVNTILRGGGKNPLTGETLNPVEVVEELNPLNEVAVSLKLPVPVKKVTLEPQGLPLPFESANGRIQLKLDSLTCHQMVVLHY